MRRMLSGAICLVALALLFTVVLVSPGIAEDPKEAILARIDQGREAFAAGRTQAAIDHLQKAIALMQSETTKGLAGSLPAVPVGWKAGEPLTNSGSWGSGEGAFQWNSASRTYTREADGVKVDITFSSSPQLVESQRAMLKMYEDPEMRKMLSQAGGQKIEVVKRDGWEGLSIIDEGKGATIAAFRGKTMLTITVSNGAAEILDKFWSTVKLSGSGGE